MGCCYTQIRVGIISIHNIKKMLKNNGLYKKHVSKGNCLDNSMMESFFGLMKNELLYVNHFESLDRFETELKKYIAGIIQKRVKLRLKE